MPLQRLLTGGTEPLAWLQWWDLGVALQALEGQVLVPSPYWGHPSSQLAGLECAWMLVAWFASPWTLSCELVERGWWVSQHGGSVRVRHNCWGFWQYKGWGGGWKLSNSTPRRSQSSHPEHWHSWKILQWIDIFNRVLHIFDITILHTWTIFSFSCLFSLLKQRVWTICELCNYPLANPILCTLKW